MSAKKLEKRMSDIKPFVALTSATSENMSRHDMLDWVNNTVNGHYKKIEELCSGIAYCQMMELLFPNCIGLKKVKMTAKMDYEQLHNLKLFQAAFTRLKMDKSVPIDRLMKGRFQDNFEFLQWFKKFFDTYAAGKENLKVQGNQNIPKPVRRPTTASTTPTTSSGKSSKSTTPKSSSATNSAERPPRSVSPNTISVLSETKEQLSKQIEAVEHERDHYYNKLLQIEKTLNKFIDDEVCVEYCQNMLKVMYAAGNNTNDATDVESEDL